MRFIVVSKYQTPACARRLRSQDTKHAAIADGEERRWMHRGAVDKFMLWKHDEKPTEDEQLLKVMRWATLASALHQPVEEDEGTIVIE